MKSLEILSKELWSAWNVYILVSMYSTKPLATVNKPGDAVRPQATGCDEILHIGKIARGGK